MVGGTVPVHAHDICRIKTTKDMLWVMFVVAAATAAASTAAVVVRAVVVVVVGEVVVEVVEVVVEVVDDGENMFKITLQHREGSGVDSS